LPIVRNEPDIAAYYYRHVIGGEAACVIVARDVTSFHTAVLEKFVTEIAQIGGQSRSGSEMWSMVSSNAVVRPESAPPTALPQHVRRALSYLRANLAEKVTLADLAAACGISQRTLLTPFERFLGISPVAHLHRMRLIMARAELQQSDGSVPISEIASRCGLAFGELPSATRRRTVESADRGDLSNGCRVSIASPFVARQQPSDRQRLRMQHWCAKLWPPATPLVPALCVAPDPSRYAMEG
jgi:AraC-like DNA-binding protein